MTLIVKASPFGRRRAVFVLRRFAVAATEGTLEVEVS